MPVEATGTGGHFLPRRSFPLGRRGSLVLLILLGGLLSFLFLGLSLEDLRPKRGGREIAVEFFSAALTPALDYEAPVAGAEPFLVKILGALWRTSSMLSESTPPCAGMGLRTVVMADGPLTM